MLPTYVVVLVWASLTGNVIVPGSSILTKAALACPDVGGARDGDRVRFAGILWARIRAVRRLDSVKMRLTIRGLQE